MRRDVQLVNGSYYHIFNKSIEAFKIFLNDKEYLRMFNTVRYYRIHAVPIPYSQFLLLRSSEKEDHEETFISKKINCSKLVEIVAYCFMPTHIHFILGQLMENGISTFMRLISNSYARYFNIKHKRKGPLWQGRFQNILVESDEQLYHLTRYIHLNPVTACLIMKPEEWRYSSYLEYVSQKSKKSTICEYDHILDIQAKRYKKFVNDQIGYQMELALIKKIMPE